MPTVGGHSAAIRASEVIGTDVYQASGEVIGKIEDIVLDKTSNQIMFAIVGFGGALTTSGNYYPLPWSILDYKEDVGGFVVPFSKDELAKGPADSVAELIKNDGAAARSAANAHYKVGEAG
jgi:sporulation protein YlmC with PRC-barrel domain